MNGAYTPTRRWEMENPEMEFLQWLLSKFVQMNDIDVETATLKEVLDKLSEELTPIGGG